MKINELPMPNSAPHTAFHRRLAFAPEAPELRSVSQKGTLETRMTRFLDRALKQFTKLHDVEKSAERLADAIERGEKIAISGDYDCDGNCSTALLCRFLGDASVPNDHVKVHIPHRFDEGYGINAGAVDEMKQWGADLLVTLDNGTLAFDPIAHALEQEMDVMVFDHHPNSEGQKLPHHEDSTALVVNANRADEPPAGKDNPFRDMAAVGVTLMMVARTHQLLEARGYYEGKVKRPNPADYIGLASVATVADVVNIAGDVNRELVSLGVEALNADSTYDPALSAMIQKSGIKGKVSSEDFAFQLGPQINAPARMDGNSISWELLSTPKDALQSPAFIEGLGKQLSLNAERKRITGSLTRLARAQVEAMRKQGELPPVLFIGGEWRGLGDTQGWHKGVMGIVASRIKEEYGHPVVAYCINPNAKTEDEQKVAVNYSARNIKVPGHMSDLGETFRTLAGQKLMSKGGGHAMAAGASSSVENLQQCIAETNRMMGDQVRDAMAHDAMPVEAWFDIADKNGLKRYAQDIAAREPFGEGNPQPTILLPNVFVEMGARDAKHLRELTLHGGSGRISQESSIKAQAYHSRGSELEAALKENKGKPVHLLATVLTNDKGESELMIHDMAVTSERNVSQQHFRGTKNAERRRTENADVVEALLGKKALQGVPAASADTTPENNDLSAPEWQGLQQSDSREIAP